MEDVGVILIISLLIGVVIGAICAAIANGRGRNATGWFFIGLASGFFGGACIGWIPILIICVIPDLKQQRRQEQYVERENRRLREQLHQERIKSETFRRHAAARLDEHDRHLGVDTKDTAPALEGGHSPRQLEASPESRSASYNRDEQGNLRQSWNMGEIQAGRQQTNTALPTETEWHYENNGEIFGPIVESELIQLFRTGVLAGHNLIWNEDMSDWTAARDVRTFQSYC